MRQKLGNFVFVFAFLTLSQAALAQKSSDKSLTGVWQAQRGSQSFTLHISVDGKSFRGLAFWPKAKGGKAKTEVLWGKFDPRTLSFGAKAGSTQGGQIKGFGSKAGNNQGGQITAQYQGKASPSLRAFESFTRREKGGETTRWSVTRKRDFNGEELSRFQVR